MLPQLEAINPDNNSIVDKPCRRKLAMQRVLESATMIDTISQFVQTVERRRTSAVRKP